MKNNILPAFICDCPFYSFFLFMLLIYNIVNSRKKTGKSFDYLQEEKVVNKMDFFFQVIYSNIVYWIFGFFVILIFILMVLNPKNNVNIEVFCKSNILRLQKYTIEYFLNIILAVMGSTAVFYSLNKKYYKIFSFNDIMKVLKIREKVILIVLNYLFAFIFCGIYYINYYSGFDSQDYYILQTMFFMFFVYCIFLLLINLFRFCKSLFKFIFSNKTEKKMLDNLYLKINNDFNSSIINDYDEVKGSLKYLLNKKKTHIKLQDSNISFVNFNDEFQHFSFKLKRKMYFRILFWSIIISLYFLLMLSVKFKLIEFNINSVLLSIVLNIALCVLLFIPPFRKLSIHMFMWSEGFSVKTNENVFYSSILKNSITDKKYDEYFRNVYSIVCLFKHVLYSREQIAIDFINELFENSESNDYLLYALCLYFYYDKYTLKRSNKYLCENFKKFCDKQNVNYKNACDNFSEVLKDIHGDYKQNIFNIIVCYTKQIKIHIKKH